nr:diphosphomevalonate decarboxylase [Ciona intestinalis]|eukprot:XP_026693140.1 diphosphomevalonate decarboxylase [Ciona intestinalis]
MEEMQEEEQVRKITCCAPINIAIIKYWGKLCEVENLPLNSSFSITLNYHDLCTTTTVTTAPSYVKDQVYVNDLWQDINENPRLKVCFEEMRRLARKQAISENAAAKELMSCSKKIHVQSVNNFPTKAGLASSASGYAALTFALGQLLGVKGDLSGVARRGSGSACRSMCGGFVEWLKSEESKNSTAKQFVDETHWPELRVFILVVSSKQKSFGSTVGMQRSVETSALLKHRIENIVPHRIKVLKQAVLEKDFCLFAEICMKESNQLHAICMDTFPPLRYLNNVSEKIMNFVYSYNERCGSTRVAYTFDAGPNAFLFTLAPFAEDLANQIYQVFPPSKDCTDTFFKTTEEFSFPNGKIVPDVTDCGLIEYVICTKPGPGPQIV